MKLVLLLAAPSMAAISIKLVGSAMIIPSLQQFKFMMKSKENGVLSIHLLILNLTE